jgi:hypothetical protein
VVTGNDSIGVVEEDEIYPPSKLRVMYIIFALAFDACQDTVFKA